MKEEGLALVAARQCDERAVGRRRQQVGEGALGGGLRSRQGDIAARLAQLLHGAVEEQRHQQREHDKGEEGQGQCEPAPSARTERPEDATRLFTALRLHGYAR